MSANEPTAVKAAKPAAVEVRSLTKHYGEVVALRDVDLSIAAGEYFVLLGPSGGGKTTLLRTIGGFHRPTRGSVLLHGADVTHLPADKRPTSMVFQSYALFPHMSVMENVGYGLKIAGLPRTQIREKANAALDLVGLAGYGQRRPHELSGGQQQRVQLARAMVLDRDVLLLDEPLASLDAQLRKDMCLELKHLQEKVGITFIHVTHNQEEAMTVADRIAVIADGELVEEGRASDIYRAPRRRFTARFVGENNMLAGKVAELSGESVVVQVADGQTVRADRRGQTVAPGDAVDLSIRSELLRVVPAGGAADVADGHSLTGQFRESVYMGLVTSHLVTLASGQDMMVRVISDSAEAPPAPGTPVRLLWGTGALRLHTN